MAIGERPDRVGLERSCSLRLIYWTKDRHSVTSAADDGSGCDHRMHYRCAEGKKFRNCRVSISVNGRKGRDLFVFVDRISLIRRP